MLGWLVDETACVLDGQRQGPAVHWGPDGSRAAAGSYTDDKMQGTWRYFDAGKLLQVATFERGEPVEP